MNDLITFNFEVDKKLIDRFKEAKWSGTCPKFYKNDVPNIIKSIEINKFYKQDFFCCFLSIYPRFKTLSSRKTKFMKSSNKVFLVGLTPTGVTDASYHWQLKDEPEFNENQFEVLWKAISIYGEQFFQKFENFPECFLEINPSDFIKGPVKLFNKYDVHNQIDFMNFQKKIYLNLNQLDMATKFSNLAKERLMNNLKGRGISFTKEYKEYYKSLEMPNS